MILAIFKKKIYVLLAIFAVLSTVSSCGIYKPVDARKVDPNVDVRARKAVEEGRGFSVDKALKGKRGGTNFEFASANVLWRATIEILDFLPLSNVDYSGGLVITDWYNEGTGSNESIKITVRFLSNEIRADGVKVIVHKKICNKNQNCVVKKIKSSLEDEVKGAILARATMMEQGILEKNAAEFRKKFGDVGKRIKERKK